MYIIFLISNVMEISDLHYKDLLYRYINVALFRLLFNFQVLDVCT